MILKGKAKFEQLDQYIARREYALALEAITEEIKRRPENFNLLLRQAEILGLAGDREKAIEVYRQLAQYYAKEGFYARAIAVTNKILRLDPGRKQVTEELAALIATQQEADRASRERMGRSVTPSPSPAAALDTPAAAPPAPEPLPGPPTVPNAPDTGPTAEEINPDQAARERDAGRFFAAFPKPALQELLTSTAVVTYGAEDVIMREGEAGTVMFLIVEGGVEVQTRDPRGAPLQLARLGPGEFFGEVAMLTGKPRTATVVAGEKVTVVQISRQDLDGLVERFPEVKEILARFQEERARATVEKVLARMRENHG